jgi:alkanesulfonate monooxygenase SsuD/methylene tetrahydromethanopterin reductase-like flavin-dependent oxidoreductase (luciferase family)
LGAALGNLFQPECGIERAASAAADSAEATTSTRDFLRDAAGEEAAAGFNVGQDDEIVSQAEELRDAGIQYLIVNMPTSGPDAVRRAAELLGALVDG